MAAAVIKGVGKLAIAAGAVYLTVDQGIWSGSSDSANTFKNLTSTYSIPNQEEYLQQIPSAKGISQQLRNGWNSGIKWSFDYLVTTPERIGNLTSSATSWVTDSLTETKE
ncbi:uncharacterized protein LOC117288575 [Asterias rubens]|uniref:uncharacterized protein LOC117288575 n=1 Tax=Asterias rubens TaxID=7604 RepID=UPI0014552818|nr:uncharacterized protein LOC117288575 [Asterias rubens]